MVVHPLTRRVELERVGGGVFLDETRARFIPVQTPCSDCKIHYVGVKVRMRHVWPHRTRLVAPVIRT